MYQQINLSDHTLVGSPAQPSSIFSGWTDGALSDISASVDPAPQGYVGQGLWPVILTVPSFNPRALALDGTYAMGPPDAVARTVAATANLRVLTAAEIAALPPRTATFAQLSAALDNLGLTAGAATAWAKLKPVVQAYFGAHYGDGIPETSPKVAKFVGMIPAPSSGPALTVAALFDKAVTE